MKNIRLLSVSIAVVTCIGVILLLNRSVIRFKSEVTTKVIIVILFNLTLIAVLILLFMVGRNLMRLYMEKVNNITGYKFKTKLVFTFVGLTLVPSVLLFIISSGLVTNYIDSWFKPFINKPLNDARVLATYIYDMIRNNTLEDAIAISKGAAPSPKYSIKRITPQSTQMNEQVLNAFKGHNSIEVFADDRADVIMATVPVWREGRVEEVLIVRTVVPGAITIKAEEIQTAYRDYVTLKDLRRPLKANYLLILGFITSLVVFMALWVALKISRGITEPIQNLMQATNLVSHGNFDVFVAQQGDDEVVMLIRSFNTMIARMKTAELSLQSAYQEADKRRLMLENIVDNINSGVIFLDESLMVKSINGAACRILNITSDGIIDQSYTNLVKKVNSYDFQRFIHNLDPASPYGKKQQLRITVAGRKMVIAIFVIPLRNENEDRIGMLIVFDDLTELIKAEKALAWQEVAKRMAHEIKNPLTPIKLSAERLLKKWRSGDSDFDKVLEKGTGTIVREVDGLQKLVNEFSRLGKMPETEPTYSDLRKIIDEVIDLYKEYETLTISLDYATDIKHLYLDNENFKRVLINIFDNAAQAIEKNGRIHISVHEDEKRSHIVLEISDSGKGIDDEDKEKLFQPYFSTRSGGTGLGLAIAHKVIAEHNGTITVSDNVPQGSTFRIELPCY